MAGGHWEKKRKCSFKKKVRFQDNVFLVASDRDELGDHGDSDTEVVESFEDMALFVGKSNRFKGRTKEDKKGESSTNNRKKTCPIKCQQEVYFNVHCTSAVLSGANLKTRGACLPKSAMCVSPV